MRNIFLTGYRCTGKTTVGKLLAQRLELEFIDADNYLVEKAGKSIKEIFADSGEGAFRDLEQQCIAELASRDGLVVAAGGGAVLRKANTDAMRSAGTVILLESDADTIYARITGDPKTDNQRPSLTDKSQYDEIVHLLEYRKPFYHAAAEHILDSSILSPQELVDAIVEILCCCTCGSSVSHANTRRTDHMRKIYVVGDSISIHYGPYLERYLKGALEYSRKEGEDEALRDLDIPTGANAGTSDKALVIIHAKIESGTLDADTILLNCGLHDIRRDPVTGEIQIPLERYRSNLCEIIQLVKKANRRLIWIRTTPCDEKVHNTPGKSFHRFAADCIAYNEAADAIMAESKVPAIDLYSFTINIGPGIYCDHVHFHEHIREKQAAYIAGWLAGRKDH